MALQDDVVKEFTEQVAQAVVHLKTDLGKLRTGRANVALLDGVRVNYYGNPTPLNQCANLAVADARLITVKPFDKKLIGEIEKAIRQADLGITPQNDGDIIRLPIPSLNEQRRKELVKQAKSRGEDAKIAIRNHRRDANELLKEGEKEREISQDDLKRALEKVQQTTDKGIQDIDQILSAKEKEILEV